MKFHPPIKAPLDASARCLHAAHEDSLRRGAIEKKDCGGAHHSLLATGISRISKSSKWVHQSVNMQLKKMCTTFCMEANYHIICNAVFIDSYSQYQSDQVS